MIKGITQNSSEDHNAALSLPDKEKWLSNQILKSTLKQNPHIQFYLKLMGYHTQADNTTRVLKPFTIQSFQLSYQWKWNIDKLDVSRDLHKHSLNSQHFTFTQLSCWQDQLSHWNWHISNCLISSKINYLLLSVCLTSRAPI